MINRLVLKFFFSECKHRFKISFIPLITKRRFMLSPRHTERLRAINEACGSIYGDLIKAGYTDLMQITYPELTFKVAYSINFVKTSHFRQTRAWRKVRLSYELNQRILNSYYNQFDGLPYCGFQKLHNLSWIESRMMQFRYLEEREFEPSTMSYLEFGGATGLLAIIASKIGFKNATNLEINSSASEIGLIIAKILPARHPMLEQK